MQESVILGQLKTGGGELLAICTPPPHTIWLIINSVGFYIVKMFLLFFESQKDPTFGFYNLAHTDVTVLHSFKSKVGMTFMNSQQEC